jgi:hypothetical protein
MQTIATTILAVERRQMPKIDKGALPFTAEPITCELTHAKASAKTIARILWAFIARHGTGDIGILSTVTYISASSSSPLTIPYNVW